MMSLGRFFVVACILCVAVAYEKMYQFPQHNFGFDLKNSAGSFQSSVQSGLGGGQQHGFDLKHSASGHGPQYGQGGWWDGFRKGWEDGMKYVKNGGKTSHTTALTGGGHHGGHHQMALAQFSNQGHIHRI